MQKPNTFVGIMGACGSGKTTINAEWCRGYRANDHRVIAYADPLKEAALAAGWSGLKDPEGRKWLQDFSNRYKAEHGEDIFLRLAMEKALEPSYASTVVFEDVRFHREIRALVDLQNKGEKVALIYVHNAEAEARWEEALKNWYLTGEKEYAWSIHESETEWRSFIEHSWNCNAVVQNSVTSDLAAVAMNFDFFVHTADTRKIIGA